MSEFKIVDFNGYKVELKSLNLKDANIIFPFVSNAMFKLGVGNFNFFESMTESDVELFQRKICENTYKIVEASDDQGRIISTKKNLQLLDIEQNIAGFLPLLCHFLEFNFGFFSSARKILEPLINLLVAKTSEKEEKTKQEKSRQF